MPEYKFNTTVVIPSEKVTHSEFSHLILSILISLRVGKLSGSSCSKMCLTSATLVRALRTGCERGLEPDVIVKVCRPAQMPQDRIPNTRNVVCCCSTKSSINERQTGEEKPSPPPVNYIGAPFRAVLIPTRASPRVSPHIQNPIH
jgi:hypothetical protein